MHTFYKRIKWVSCLIIFFGCKSQYALYPINNYFNPVDRPSNSHQYTVASEDFFSINIQQIKSALKTNNPQEPTSDFNYIDYKIIDDTSFEGHLVEQTYLWLNGYSNGEQSGVAIYFMTTPMLTHEFQKKYFNTEDTTLLNVAKQTYVGYWAKDLVDSTIALVFHRYYKIKKCTKYSHLFKMNGSVGKANELKIERISHREEFIQLKDENDRIAFKRTLDKRWYSLKDIDQFAKDSSLISLMRNEVEIDLKDVLDLNENSGIVLHQFRPMDSIYLEWKQKDTTLLKKISAFNIDYECLSFNVKTEDGWYQFWGEKNWKKRLKNTNILKQPTIEDNGIEKEVKVL